jgi:hypothetical protein
MTRTRWKTSYFYYNGRGARKVRQTKYPTFEYSCRFTVCNTNQRLAHPVSPMDMDLARVDSSIIAKPFLLRAAGDGPSRSKIFEIRNSDTGTDALGRPCLLQKSSKDSTSRTFNTEMRGIQPTTTHSDSFCAFLARSTGPTTSYGRLCRSQ